MKPHEFILLLCGLGFVFFGGSLIGSVIVLRDCHSNYSKGIYKTYSWSDVKDLNAELAKGYKVIRTYDVTNMVLEKVESKFEGFNLLLSSLIEETDTLARTCTCESSRCIH